MRTKRHGGPNCHDNGPSWHFKVPACNFHDSWNHRENEIGNRRDNTLEYKQVIFTAVRTVGKIRLSQRLYGNRHDNQYICNNAPGQFGRLDAVDQIGQG